MSHRKILLIARRVEPHSPALNRAAALIRAGGGTLHLCLFEQQPLLEAVAHLSSEVARQAREAQLAEAHHWLNDKVQALRETGVKAEGEVVWGRPLLEHMLAKIHQQQPSLVIKDIHLEPLLRRVLLTPIDWHLLRDCPCPLMLVNPQALPLPRRVVAAVEPVAAEHSEGHLNERIAQLASDLARLSGASTELAYAYEGLSPLAVSQPEEYTVIAAEIYEQLRQTQVERFHRFAAAQGVPAERQQVLYGPPWLALADCADDPRADLLVLGSVQRSGLERALIGSTAERILDQARCDLLVVKPEAVAAQ